MGFLEIKILRFLGTTVQVFKIVKFQGFRAKRFSVIPQPKDAFFADCNVNGVFVLEY
jgi:hypothetical protein